MDTDDAFAVALRAGRAGSLTPLQDGINVRLMMIRDNPDLPAASGHWAGEAAQFVAQAQAVIRGRLASIRRRRVSAQARTWATGTPPSEWIAILSGSSSEDRREGDRLNDVVGPAGVPEIPGITQKLIPV